MMFTLGTLLVTVLAWLAALEYLGHDPFGFNFEEEEE